MELGLQKTERHMDDWLIAYIIACPLTHGIHMFFTRINTIMYILCGDQFTCRGEREHRS